MFLFQDMGKCLRSLGVNPVSTRDDKGRQRFNILSVEKTFRGEYPAWLRRRSFYPPKSGYDCCSDEWVSFHFTTPEKMIRLRTVIDRQAELYRQNQTAERRPTFKNLIDTYLAYGKFADLMAKAKLIN
jgi:hypothetical protein